jgi:hypothetical protein
VHRPRRAAAGCEKRHPVICLVHELKDEPVQKPGAAIDVAPSTRGCDLERRRANAGLLFGGEFLHQRRVRRVRRERTYAVQFRSSKKLFNVSTMISFNSWWLNAPSALLIGASLCCINRAVTVGCLCSNFCQMYRLPNSSG